MSALTLGADLASRIQRMAQTPGRATPRASAGVPARIMVPRTIFIVCAVGLTLFGMLMIYSSSSIVGLTSKAYGYDSAYFLVRQLLFVGIGLVFGGILAWMDYHKWRDRVLKVAWVVTVLMLALVYTPVAGHDVYGATRWISILGFSLQPSEFAKVTVILTGANIAEQYWELGMLEDKEALKMLGVGVAVPLVLILLQPDKGTTGVLVLTLLVMGYLAGVPGKAIGVVFLAVLGIAAVIALRDDYSRARIMTVFDPFTDEFGAGYQLVQGFYALGSGGLTGVGLGLSRQKYNYLPMAHNDFIFAVIGEELGIVGTVGLLAVFALLFWAGLKIAENASDLTGRLIAAGCTSLIVIQLLLNVSGVIGIFPLSGKPVPFISYGGSSIISTLMIVGLVVSVSMRSELPQTQYDRRRAQLRIADESVSARYGRVIEDSTAGEAIPRSRGGVPLRGVPGVRPATTVRLPERSRLRIVDSGDSLSLTPRPKWPKGTSPNGQRGRGTIATSSSARRYGREGVDYGWQKSIDLGPSPAERLRGQRGQR